MKRIISYYLKQWAKSSYRKPLILKGARQVGKTHVIRQLGSDFESYIEINFEELPSAINIFENDINLEHILSQLSLIAGKKIIPGKTLLFLDEIQVAPRAITALRYFFEKMPELHVIAAGSLIDFIMEQISVPVGRVEFMYMYPLSFVEFLYAHHESVLIEEILNHQASQALPETVHKKLLYLFGSYMIIGGMPEVVANWIFEHDIAQVSSIQQALVDSYQQDFLKYSKKTQLKYLSLLFERIPMHQGKQIKYSSITEDYRKRELAPCLDLLCKAKVVYKIYQTHGNGLPLGAESDREKFKLLFIDVALSQKILGLDTKEWLLDQQQQLINKGYLKESFVGQELLAYAHPSRQRGLYYWDRNTRGSIAEVDYLVQKNELIIPVEVKSSKGNSLQSLRLYLNSHPKTKFGIRCSEHNYSEFDAVQSYPLYALAGIFSEDKEGVLQLLS